jgi:hypothetical protein
LHRFVTRSKVAAAQRQANQDGQAGASHAWKLSKHTCSLIGCAAALAPARRCKCRRLASSNAGPGGRPSRTCALNGPLIGCSGGDGERRLARLGHGRTELVQSAPKALHVRGPGACSSSRSSR